MSENVQMWIVVILAGKKHYKTYLLKIINLVKLYILRSLNVLGCVA